MDEIGVVGISILMGYLVGKLMGSFNIGNFKIPAVAGYVIIGIIFGQSIMNLFTREMLTKLDIVSDIALGLIAITIGGELKWGHLKKLSKSLFPIVLLESLGAMILVTTSLQIFFGNWALSLVLGSISAATAPAATVAVIQESGASGTFTSTLLALVAVDDAIALILYGFASAVAKAMLSTTHVISFYNVFIMSITEIGGAFIIGIAGGLALGPWLKRILYPDVQFSLTIGMMFFIISLSNQYHFSALLANMTFGVVITNIAPFTSKRVFERISMVTLPVFTAFFVIGGAHLRVDLLPSLGLIGVVYLVARMGGKVGGASLGAIAVRAPSVIKKYIGFGLLSQVGVAIGLSLVVAKEFTPLGEEGKMLAVTIINILLATTVITEILGPMLTRYALLKAGETDKVRR
jgi:Kef-type K+ transport system membrane component KefB